MTVHQPRHREQVVSGAAAQIEGGNVRIHENINKQLSESFESFLNATARAVKTGVKGLCTFMGIDNWILFRKQSAFEDGIER